MLLLKANLVKEETVFKLTQKLLKLIAKLADDKAKFKFTWCRKQIK